MFIEESTSILKLFQKTEKWREAKHSITHLFTHSTVDGHLDLHFLSIMNSAAMNTCVQVLVWTCYFISLRSVLRYEIAGSYNSV